MCQIPYKAKFGVQPKIDRELFSLPGGKIEMLKPKK